MSNSKRLLSALMALVMVLGMFSCLGSVVANASFLDNTVVNGIYTGLNGTGEYMGQVTWKGYRNNEWGLVTPENFARYNALHQDYDNGFGIKTMDELRAEYGTQPFLYLGIEILEDDGEPTDHFVYPGQELTLNFYIKSDYYCAGYSSMIFFTRSFFDIDGAAHSRASGKTTKTAGAYWTAASNKNGDGLNSTGYRTSSYCLPEENEDREFLFSEYLDATATIGDVYALPATTLTGTGLSQDTINSLSWYMISADVNTETTEYGFNIDEDEYFYSYTFNVRDEDEPYHKSASNAVATQFINPFEEFGIIGEIGADYRLSRDYFSKVTNYYYLTDAEDVEIIDMQMPFDYGVITDTRDMNHVFILGEPEDYPYDPSDEPGPTTATHNVTFVADGVQVGDAIEVEEGAAIDVTAPEVPAKTGYTGAWETIPATMGTEDITINAVYTAINYNVYFAVDGVVDESKTLVKNYGDAIDVSAVTAEKAGHTFTGWANVPATMPAEDVTLNAMFDANNYNVNYEVDGVIVHTDSVAYGAPINTITAPTKDGYTFSGWQNVPATMPAEDVTITGTFTADSYDIVYYVDGVEYARETYATDAAITPVAEPSQTGYTFSGWDNVPATMPAGGAEVNGTYTANTYVITVLADGEEIGEIEATYGAPVSEEDFANIDVPEKTGYDFAGFDSIPATMPAEDITVNVVYTAIDYTLTLVADGETVAALTYNYGDTVDASAYTAEKTGYDFIGWDNLPDTMPAEDVTATAIFEAIDYTITFVVDGEAYGPTLTYNYGDIVDISEVAEPTKTGATFSGWKNVPATMPAEDVVITGSFGAVEYTVTFVLDNGEDDIVATLNYGDAIVVPEEPTKVGYTFAGWDVEPEATMPAADVTYTATWNINTYTVSYYDYDGSLIEEFDVEYNAEVDVTEEPSREGYTFAGWDAEIPAAMPAEDISFTATYTINTYTVTYIVDGEVLYTDEYDFGEAITAKLDEVKTGYTFSGWSEIPATMPAENIEVTATFTINQYTVTFAGVDADAKTVDYDTPLADVVADVNPVAEEGYYFNGWTYTVDGVAYTGANVPAGDVVATANFKRAVDIESCEVSATKVVKGDYITWTIVTALDVEYIKLKGTYELADGSKKSITVMYKNTSTSANVSVTDGANNRTWVIKQKANYTATDYEVDSKVDQAYTVSYKLAGAAAYDTYDQDYTVTIGATADAFAEETKPVYAAYTCVSAAGPETVALNARGEVTIVTTDDCTKVRIGTNGKYTTFQTTSANTSYVDEDGIRTWTINYKFATAGANEYTVNARGVAWGDAQTFTTTVA